MRIAIITLASSVSSDPSKTFTSYRELVVPNEATADEVEGFWEENNTYNDSLTESVISIDISEPLHYTKLSANTGWVSVGTYEDPTELFEAYLLETKTDDLYEQLEDSFNQDVYNDLISEYRKQYNAQLKTTPVLLSEQRKLSQELNSLNADIFDATDPTELRKLSISRISLNEKVNAVDNKISSIHSRIANITLDIKDTQNIRDNHISVSNVEQALSNIKPVTETNVVKQYVDNTKEIERIKSLAERRAVYSSKRAKEAEKRIKAVEYRIEHNTPVKVETTENRLQQLDELRLQFNKYREKASEEETLIQQTHEDKEAVKQALLSANKLSSRGVKIVPLKADDKDLSSITKKLNEHIKETTPKRSRGYSR